MSLSAAYQSGDFHILPEPGEALGFVLPTYFGVLPSIVVDFLEQTEIWLDSLITDISEKKRIRVKGEWHAPMLLMMKKVYKGICPENSIAYTRATIGHGQYYNPKTAR